MCEQYGGLPRISDRYPHGFSGALRELSGSPFLVKTSLKLRQLHAEEWSRKCLPFRPLLQWLISADIRCALIGWSTVTRTTLFPRWIVECGRREKLRPCPKIVDAEMLLTPLRAFSMPEEASARGIASVLRRGAAFWQGARPPFSGRGRDRRAPEPERCLARVLPDTARLRLLVDAMALGTCGLR